MVWKFLDNLVKYEKRPFIEQDLAYVFLEGVPSPPYSPQNDRGGWASHLWLPRWEGCWTGGVRGRGGAWALGAQARRETLDWLTPGHGAGVELKPLPQASPRLETQGAWSQLPVGGLRQARRAGSLGVSAAATLASQGKSKGRDGERVCVRGLSDRGGGKKEGCL